jgi:REP-associated tyrosine transposase
MARPLRVEYPGAYYHVMNRGNRRQTVFLSENDVDLFLEKLGGFSSAYHVRILCYCLMNNHFHLYLKTEDANLSKFMQALLTSFTISKNRRDHSSGHLFQGRYKAFIVEDKEYGSVLSRYIHLNPVRTLTTSNLDLSKKRKLLRVTNKLNSYPALIGLSKAPEWLSSSLTLKRWGKTRKEQMKNYSKYVEKGLTREIADPMESAVAQTILGSESFVDKIRRSLTDISENINLRRELGDKAKLFGSLDVTAVIDAVCRFYKVDRNYILTKNSRNNEARQVLLYLSCKFCRGKYSLSKLGEHLGALTVGSLTSSRYKMAIKINNDRNLKAKIKKIEDYIVKK